MVDQGRVSTVCDKLDYYLGDNPSESMMLPNIAAADLCVLGDPEFAKLRSRVVRLNIKPIAGLK
jgi:hypothetical protein